MGMPRLKFPQLPLGHSPGEALGGVLRWGWARAVDKLARVTFVSSLPAICLFCRSPWKQAGAV